MMSKAYVLAVLLIFSCGVSSTLLAQTSKEDKEFVSEVIHNPSLLGWGSVEKRLNRMGDRAASALLEGADARELQKHDNASTALKIVSRSFAAPNLIEQSGDRLPNRTTVLLDHISRSATDEATAKDAKALSERISRSVSLR